MIKRLILLPLLLSTSPALAQRPAPQLADPATADRVANVVQTLSDALLNIPVGEVQAAVEGRHATPVERRMTLRDVARRDDPDFDRKLDRHIAAARPMLRQSLKAVNDALPAVIQGLQQAQQSF